MSSVKNEISQPVVKPTRQLFAGTCEAVILQCFTVRLFYCEDVYWIDLRKVFLNPQDSHLQVAVRQFFFCPAGFAGLAGPD